MVIRLEKSWKKLLQEEFTKEYFKNLISFVKKEYKARTIYPRASFIFKALDATPFKKVKVVILGQDPYVGPNQANGLCFSVNDNIRMPPSLINIFKEIHTDLGKPIPKSGNLEHWAGQGVLLLNATLTVRASAPASHQGRGWEEFTNAIIKLLSDKRKNLVFLLWGAYAQRKGVIIDREKHLVLEAPHPSPFSADKGFFGCKHFSKTNKYLQKYGVGSIVW